MTGLLESAGAQVRNPSRGKPVTPALRFETGLFTNRSPIHDPSSWIYAHFYQGYQDTLIDGLNMEISNQLTLVRRPGLSHWSSVPVPNPPNWFYNWNTLDQGVKVVVDTAFATNLPTSSARKQIFSNTLVEERGFCQDV